MDIGEDPNLPKTTPGRNRSTPALSHAIQINSTDIPALPSFLCRPYQPGLRSMAPSPMMMRGSPSMPPSIPNSFQPQSTPYTARKPVARSNTKKVALFKGNLVLDCPVPTRLMEASARKDKEFSMMRYSAVTCDPNEFATSNYTLRPQIMNRETELFVVMTMYNVRYIKVP